MAQEHITPKELICYLDRQAGVPTETTAREVKLSPITASHYALKVTNLLKRSPEQIEYGRKLTGLLIPNAVKELAKRLPRIKDSDLLRFLEGVGVLRKDVQILNNIVYASMDELKSVIKQQAAGEVQYAEVVEVVDSAPTTYDTTYAQDCINNCSDAVHCTNEHTQPSIPPMPPNAHSEPAVKPTTVWEHNHEGSTPDQPPDVCNTQLPGMPLEASTAEKNESANEAAARKLFKFGKLPYLARHRYWIDGIYVSVDRCEWQEDGGLVLETHPVRKVGRKARRQVRGLNRHKQYKEKV